MLKRLFALLLCLLMLPLTALAAASPSEELRGVWVSSVYNLDYPTSATADAASLKKQADAVLDGAKDMGYNAIFLQVRPSADALYASDLFPWSRYVTGTVGQAPADGFDPLEYFVKGAHKRGLALHAWINPYRVTRSKDAEWNAIPANSPAKQHPDWVVKYTDGNYYFNPGLPQVEQLVVDGALEILDKYDVDGIHLDDYFYPGTDFNDASTYAKYGAGFGSIADWRRDNVNRMVKKLGEAVHNADSSLAFGISPAGIWDNKKTNPRGSDTAGHSSYSQNYADSLYWMENGLIDYICPQLYWNIGYEIADFETLVNWWSDAASRTGTRLYIGLAGYRTAEAKDASSVWYGGDEIIRQLEMIAENRHVAGTILFRYGSLTACPTLQSKISSHFESHASAQAGGQSFWSVFLTFLRSVTQ